MARSQTGALEALAGRASGGNAARPLGGDGRRRAAVTGRITQGKLSRMLERAMGIEPTTYSLGRRRSPVQDQTLMTIWLSFDTECKMLRDVWVRATRLPAPQSPLRNPLRTLRQTTTHFRKASKADIPSKRLRDFRTLRFGGSGLPTVSHKTRPRTSKG